MDTRLPGAVPQPLFLNLFDFGYIIFLRSSSICQKNWGCLPNHCFYFNCFWLLYFFEVVFHFQKNWGRLPLKKSIEVFHFKIYYCFYFSIFLVALFFWGHFPFKKKLRSSSFFKIIEVVFHFQKYWGRLPYIF